MGAQSDSNAQKEFFESKVRPLLAKNCFSCHVQAKMGGLAMDTRESMIKGGQDGPQERQHHRADTGEHDEC